MVQCSNHRHACVISFITIPSALQRGLQLTKQQEDQILLARKIALAELMQIAEERKEIMSGLFMELLKTRKVGTHAWPRHADAPLTIAVQG